MPLKILSSVQTSGILIAPESTTNNASIRVPHGVAPTSPTNGDIWTTSAGLHVRISGATINLGNGTVTSVGLALPAIFSVSNSPVTTSGTLTATLASQTANTFLAAPSGSNGVPSFRAIVDADIPITYTASLRANVNISGGGTITVNATGSVLWSQRFIIISNGRGSNFSTNGYFDITCPTSGTITGVGGASNKTATAAGIPLSEWEAIYYILPIGSGSASVAANFRVVNYTSNLDIPDEWVLVCLRNGENSQFYFTAGYTLPLSGSIITGTYNARRANFADQLTTARTIGGVSFDGSANINLPGVNTAGNQNTTGSAATLTTARTLTIGSTGKTFNGSANVAWTLAEIGATPITGGTGYIQNQSASAQSASFWINGSSIMNNLITERANDANIGQGQIYLNGATGNRIDFNTNGVAAPTLNTTSVGSKIVLFPQVSASSVDYALGIESNHMWFSVPTSNSRFKFYAGTTNVTSIYGNGNIVTTGEISTTGNVTGHTFGGDIGSFNELIADTTLIVGDGSNTTTAYAIIKNLYLSKDDVAGGKNLLFESDTTTIDNKKLSFKIVDSSTGSKTSVMTMTTTERVGVGTDSPNAKFQVSGAGSGAEVFLVSPSGAPTVGIKADSTITDYSGLYIGNKHIIRSKDSATVFFNIQDGLTYVNGNSARTTMNSAGSLGLGITSIGDINSRLHVRGTGATSATTALRVENSNASTLLTILDDGVWNFSQTGTVASIRFGNQGSNSPFLFPYTTTVTIGNQSGRNLAFYNYNTSGDLQNGSFGFAGEQISKTSGTTIQIFSSRTFAPSSGTATFANFQINTIINQTGGANGQTYGIIINPTLTSAADWRSIQWQNNTGFGLYGAGTANNYLAGNLGIGTTNPSSSLHVEGDVQIGTNKLKLGASNADSYIQHNGSNLITHFQSNWGGDFKFRAADLTGTQYDILFIEGSNQRVGIGTTIPYASLHTVGAGIVNIVQSSDTVSYTQYYNSSTGTNTTNDGLTVGINGWSAYVFNREAGNLIFGTSGTERMSISSAGNVGIGTATPFQKLYVDGDIGLKTANFLNLAGDQGSSRTAGFQASFASYDKIFVYTNNSIIGSLSRDNGWGIGFSTQPSSRLQVRGSGATSATTALRVENSNASASLVVLDDGNVGIGTTSPLYKLYVDSGTSDYPAAFVSSDTTSQIIFKDSTTTAFGSVRVGAVGNELRLNSGPNGTEGILTMNASGNVGIGTTSPSVRLHISGTSATNELVYLTGDASQGSAIRFNRGSSYSWRMGVVPNSNFTIEDVSYSTVRFQINNTSGLIGINTTSPNARLHISGANNEALLIASSSTAPSALFVSGSGNVGIGTTSPTVSLQVAGIISSSGNITTQGEVKNTNELANNTTFIRTFGGNNDYTALRLGNAPDVDSGSWGFSIKYMGSRSGNENSLSIFTDNQSAASQIEALTIFQDGKIGIGTTGTTSPTSHLQVRGSGATSATTALRVENSAGTPALIVRNDGRTFVGEDYTFTSSQRYYLLEASADGLVSFTNNTTNVAQTTGFFSGELYLDGSQPYTNHRAVNAITTCRNTSTSNVIRALYASGRTNNSGAASTVTGLTGDLNIEGSGSVTNAIAVEVGMYSLTNTKTITNMYGLRVNDIINTVGTITNTYGIHVGDVTSGTQTNTAYSLYVSDANARSYFAGKVGIGQTNPTNLFEVYSSTTPKLVVGSANVGLQIAPNEFVDIASYPTDNKYIRIRADKVSNNPHYEAGSPQEGMGVLDNNVYLAEPNYWIEIKLGGDGGDNPVLIPCYLPKP